MDEPSRITGMSKPDRQISEIFAEERSRLRNFIRRRVPDPSDAEDIVQEVFYELVEANRLLMPIEHVTGWLFRVARNRITDLFRKKKPETFSDAAVVDEDGEVLQIEDLLPSPDAGPEALYFRNVLLDELEFALDELPDEQREVFVAHELEGRSFKELSAESGVSVNTQYGPPDVLQFTDVAKPTAKDDEVLIKLYAASVNPLDWHFMRGDVRLMTGLLTPRHKILGVDIAGRVEAVGRQVKQFQPGDEVFGVTGFAGGGFAEYACAPEDKLALKPANSSFEDAAAVPIAAITALRGLRDKGRIQRGHKVLVDGASGGVGTFAVQIAKSFGAEVTAVCSTRNVGTARAIGADHVIDYTREDFTKSGQRYDLILGANVHHSIFDYRRALRQDGIYVIVGGGLARIFQAMLLAPLLSLIGSKKTRFFIANINQKDLVFLKDLLEAGKVVPVIDRRYPLSDAAEAIRYLEEGHAQGKVVITVEHGNALRANISETGLVLLINEE